MLILLFILDFLTPPADPLNDNNEASTVVDIDSLTRGPVNDAQQASTSSRREIGSAVVLNRQITNLESTAYGALNLTEGAVSSSTNRSPITGTNAVGRPAGTIPSRSANLINSQHDHTSSSQHDCHHHDQNQNDDIRNALYNLFVNIIPSYFVEASGRTHHDQDEPSPSPSTSTSTSSTYDHEKKKNKKKSKEVLLCAGGESNANRTCSSSSSNTVSTSFTRHEHAMTSNAVDQPNSPHDQNRQNHNNLEPFLNFLREQELSKNLTQIAIAVATCLYGNSEAIHPTMRMALVMLLSVGVQCFWCGTLRRNVRIEQLGHVLIIAALHLLLANLMLPSPWALIPAVTFVAFLITLGIHFRRELG